MKEQIYIPEYTNASFEIELKKRSKNYKPVSLESNSGNYNPDMKTIYESVNEESSTITEFQKIKQSIRLILELKKEDKQIFQKQFFSKIFISNIDFDYTVNNNQINVPNEKEKDKKDTKDKANLASTIITNVPYNLILKLDLSECPNELKSEIEDPEFEYFWFIRIFSTENISFMKDTSKEEAESQLKEGWEAKQPGRAERAKLSRKKYLLHVKKQRGELLSPEEENLLNELKNRVYITNLNNSATDSQKKAPDNAKKTTNVNAANNNSANSNSNKNAKQSNIITDPLADEKAYNQAQLLKQSFYARMNKTRIFPKPENHCSLYLKNFLSYVYRDRTIESKNKMIKSYLNDDKLEELSKTLDEKLLEYNNKRKKEELDFNEKKRKLIEETNQVNKKHYMQRRQYSTKLNDILSAREKISNDYQIHSEKEKSLQDIINGDYDLEKCVQIYKDICINTNDYQKFKNLCVQVFTYISEKKDEIYKNEIKKFNIKDKGPLIKCFEDYKQNNWNISEETVKKLNELGKN